MREVVRLKFQEKLVALRKGKGMSQEQLAEKLGVSRQAISRWESGESTPDMLNLLGLCECFQVSSDYLLHDDYKSDADIPLVKQKEEEIVEVKLKRKNMHLIAAICFLITTFCAIMGLVTSGSNVQFAVACFWAAFAAVNAVVQFVLYLKK